MYELSLAYPGEHFERATFGGHSESPGRDGNRVRKLKKDGWITDGELKVYDEPVLPWGLALADLRHGAQRVNKIVLAAHGVVQTIELKCSSTNFGGVRWCMIDSKHPPFEIGYLWGNYYASRQDIGVINYGSQCQPRWSRLQQKKAKTET